MEFWSAAFAYAVAVKNILPRPGKEGGNSSFEQYYGFSPNLDHFRMFGAVIAVYVSKEVRLKGDTPGVLARWCGFAGDQSGILYWNLDEKKFGTCSFEQYKVLSEKSRFDADYGWLLNQMEPKRVTPETEKTEEAQKEKAPRKKKKKRSKETPGEQPNDFLSAGVKPQAPSQTHGQNRM